MKISSKIQKTLLLSGLALCLSCVLALWFYISQFVAEVRFSGDRYCRMEFHQWHSGNCVLYYYENGVCNGKVVLASDLFITPLAVFPGPDGYSAVCLSWPDTFHAAFTVDFTKRNAAGVEIPERLRLPGQETVEYSNFLVRACTMQEVEFVENYIKETDFETLSKSARGRFPADGREGLLQFLYQATRPQDRDDPVLQYATPMIMPVREL